MIEISLSTALALYGGIIITGTLLLWIYTEINVQRAQKVMTKQYLWRCTFCAFSYLDEEASAFSRCPRCGSITAHDDKGAREVKTPKPAAEACHAEEPPKEQPRRNPSRGKRPGARTRGPRRRG